MVKHFHQVIYCSTRERRAFLREITVAPNNAMVTGVEKLPPNYDIPYEKMRNQNEEVLKYYGELEYAENTSNLCPFCGNDTQFFCSCSTISCHNATALTAFCPGCKRVHKTQTINIQGMSKSGFLHGEYGIQGQPQNRNWLKRTPFPPIPEPPPSLGAPGSNKLAGRVKMKKYLEEKKKLQIEDKRDK